MHLESCTHFGNEGACSASEEEMRNKNWEVNQILEALCSSPSNLDLIRKVIERYRRHKIMVPTHERPTAE